jgi:D-3-phosphoglycerate dehydrogenase
MTDRPRVLVAEEIAESGLDLLRETCDVEVALDLDPEALKVAIADVDAILIRSATTLDEATIEAANSLRVIGRAGVGVNNVDVAAATRKGIVVANAPQSNIIAAAEHTVALMLAMARNIPQAHSALKDARWERSRFGGVEVYEKTLGIIGFGRIGQLVAQRAKAFGMNILGFDPFVTAERFRELGVEPVEGVEAIYASADFITIHLPSTPETKDFLSTDQFAAMKDGVRIINCARGELIDDAALQAAIDSGKVAGAALDVFVKEPITDHPLFDGYENVIVTPHLGASTVEAQDRAGVQTAAQVLAALTGGTVTTAVNLPAISAEDRDVLGPFVPLCRDLSRIAVDLAGSVDRLEVEILGRIAERDSRPLVAAALMGALAGRTVEDVNEVNAASFAQDRGIEVEERLSATARDYTDLVRITAGSRDGESVRLVGTVIGQLNRPHLLEVWGLRLDLQLEDHLTLIRYRDLPGMLGRIGTEFGRHGVNIVSAAVGRQPETDGVNELAAIAITTDAPVPQEALTALLSETDFEDARTLTL